jgi:hypothetical protein
MHEHPVRNCFAIRRIFPLCRQIGCRGGFMNEEKRASSAAVPPSEAGRNRYLLEQRVQSCRCWLSILRAAGRNRLLSEQQVALREIDAAMKDLLNRETGERCPLEEEAERWSVEKTDLILTVIKHCLSELQYGHGLSPGSMMRLNGFRKVGD